MPQPEPKTNRERPPQQRLDRHHRQHHHARSQWVSAWVFFMPDSSYNAASGGSEKHMSFCRSRVLLGRAWLSINSSLLFSSLWGISRQRARKSSAHIIGWMRGSGGCCFYETQKKNRNLSRIIDQIHPLRVHEVKADAGRLFWDGREIWGFCVNNISFRVNVLRS